MTWLDAPWLSFDVETTGTDVFTDRIVSATLVKINGKETSTRQWVIDPGIDVPTEASNIHGFTTERVRAGGRTPLICLREIALGLGSTWTEGKPVIIYNAPFDTSILNAELIRYEMPPLTEWTRTGIRPVIDPLCLDKHFDRYRKGKRTLTAACAHYRVALDGAHDATADALGSARIVWRMARQYPALAAMSLDELHDAQVDWYRDQAEGLAAYFRKQGNDETVSTAWPIRPCAINLTAPTEGVPA